MKRTLFLFLAALLVLNLAGAAASRASDCGMGCCLPAHCADLEALEAPSCCGSEGVACDYEAGHFEKIPNGAVSGPGKPFHPRGLAVLFPSAFPLKTFPNRGAPAPLLENPQSSLPAVPLYLSNASHLC